jgi:hypothetical protein
MSLTSILNIRTTVSSFTAALKAKLDAAYLHSRSTHAPSDAVTLAQVKADTDIAAAIANSGVGPSLDNYVTKETGKGLSANDLTDTLKGNYDAAYSHSQATHADPSNAATAYNHSQAAHAPSNAQKNSDITKEEIEAKVTILSWNKIMLYSIQ